MRRTILTVLLLAGCRNYALLRDGVHPLADGGVVDAAPDPASLDGATGDSCAGAIFCERFEGAFSTAWIPSMVGPVEVSLDTKHAHTGAQAGHVLASQPMDDPGFAYGVLQYRLPSLPTDLHVRAFFYRAGMTNESAQLFQINKNVNSQGGFDGVYVHADATRISVIDVANGTVTSSFDATTSLRPDAWTCVTIDITAVGSKAPLVTIALDGTTALASSPVSEGYGSGSAVTIGQLVLTGDVTPIEFWIDDLEISTEPIGCNP